MVQAAIKVAHIIGRGIIWHFEILGIGFWRDKTSHRQQLDTIANHVVSLIAQGCAGRTARTDIGLALFQGVIDVLVECVSVFGSYHLLSQMHMIRTIVGFTIYESYTERQAWSGAHTFHIVFLVLICGRIHIATEYDLHAIAKHNSIGAAVCGGPNYIFNVQRCIWNVN